MRVVNISMSLMQNMRLDVNQQTQKIKYVTLVYIQNRPLVIHGNLANGILVNLTETTRIWIFVKLPGVCYGKSDYNLAYQSVLVSIITVNFDADNRMQVQILRASCDQFFLILVFQLHRTSPDSVPTRHGQSVMTHYMRIAICNFVTLRLSYADEGELRHSFRPQNRS